MMNSPKSPKSPVFYSLKRSIAYKGVNALVNVFVVILCFIVLLCAITYAVQIFTVTSVKSLNASIASSDVKPTQNAVIACDYTVTMDMRIKSTYARYATINVCMANGHEIRRNIVTYTQNKVSITYDFKEENNTSITVTTKTRQALVTTFSVANQHGNVIPGLSTYFDGKMYYAALMLTIAQ